MKNFFELKKRVIRLLQDVPRMGGAVAITGPTGIGKSFLLDQLCEEAKDTCFIVRFDGQNLPRKSLEAVYQGLYHSVSGGQLRLDFGKRLLEKYVQLIPGFGQYLSPIIGGINGSRTDLVLERRGLSFGGSPPLHVANFIRDASVGQNTLIVVDDIQWLDSESWSCVFQIASESFVNDWTCLMTLNTDLYQSEEFLQTIHKETVSDSNKRWIQFTAEKWDSDSVAELCSQILGKRVELTKQCRDRLIDATDGIPLYVESALHVLKTSGELISDGEGALVPASNWPVIDLDEGLNSFLERKLKETYLMLPSSRRTLEAASVLGDPFKDNDLESIFSIVDAFDNLGSIERKHSLVRYLIGLRSWRFSHPRIQKLVYDSLGSQAKSLHLEIAKAFAENAPNESSLIAFHFQKGGDAASTIDWNMKEIERLLGIGLFQAAFLLAEETLECEISISFNQKSQRSIEIQLLKSKSQFGLHKFGEALGLLEENLRNTKGDRNRAHHQRWIGKCHLKLATQYDFQKAVESLESAASTFAKLSEPRMVAACQSDLVVAHAHRNDFKSAEISFEIAEKLLNMLEDRIEMARLQRRNVIFMEDELSEKIQDRLAATFDELGIPHEKIMSLNNAATVNIVLDDLKKAKNQIEVAISDSLDLANFGATYLYNNLAIIYLLTNQHEHCRIAIKNAKEHSSRTVLDLILNVTESVLDACQFGVADAFDDIRKARRFAESTGENAYIEPAILNEAVALRKLGKPQEASSLLLRIRPRKDIGARKNKLSRWFDEVVLCFAELGLADQESHFREKFSWIQSKRQGRFEEFSFALIDTQFWSD